MDLRDYIRDVPDFPKPGIVFKDITPLLRGPAGVRRTRCARSPSYARPLDVELIVAAEARGFIFGGALARELGVGFVPARKPGKLPHETISVQYGLEYGLDELQLHADALTRRHARADPRRRARHRRHREGEDRAGRAARRAWSSGARSSSSWRSCDGRETLAGYDVQRAGALRRAVGRVVFRGCRGVGVARSVL